MRDQYRPIPDSAPEQAEQARRQKWALSVVLVGFVMVVGLAMWWNGR